MEIPPRSLKSPGVIIATLSALSLGIVGLGLYLMLRPSSTSQAPVDEMAIAQPSEARKITALGRIEPEGGIYNIASPSSIGASRVLRILVQEGQAVQQGQPLAVMDSYEQLRSAAIQAEAQVKEAQSELNLVKAGEKSSDIQAELANARAEEVNVKVQQVNVGEQDANVNERLAAVAAKKAARNRISAELRQVERDLKQAKTLASEGALADDIAETRQFELAAKKAELGQADAEITQAEQQLEQAKRQRQQALGEVLRREQQLAQATEQFKSARQVRPEEIQRSEAAVQSALANLAKAKAELNQAAVLAPIAGQVLKIHANNGEAVGDRGILDLGRTDRMTVVGEVYETDIRDVKLGQSVTVTSPALVNPIQGRVAQIGLKIDKKDVLDTDPAADIDARVIEVTVLLENSELVASLTNLQVNLSIDTASPALRPSASGINIPGQPGERDFLDAPTGRGEDWLNNDRLDNGRPEAGAVSPDPEKGAAGGSEP